MPMDQIILFSLLVVVFGMLIWGRFAMISSPLGRWLWRLFSMWCPHEKAFDGFGHEATIIIALVLVISRGLSNSGAIDLDWQRGHRQEPLPVRSYRHYLDCRRRPVCCHEQCCRSWLC